MEFLAIGGNVDKAAYWRFPDGTHFSYRGRVYRKDSFCSATYVDKLHGVSLEYFFPLRQFTFVNPEKGFEGTVINDEEMAVIMIDDPVEYSAARCDYLDVLLARARERERRLEFVPHVPKPLLVDIKDTWPALLRTLFLQAIALPRLYVLYGHIATTRHWASFWKEFQRLWSEAQIDFWNQPARKLDGDKPWKPNQK